MFQLPALVSHWWIKTRWLIDASIWLRGKLVDGIWNESEKIKEWLLHQTFHSPTVTFFLVLTIGACLYSALLLRHSSPLPWWFFMFMVLYPSPLSCGPLLCQGLHQLVGGCIVQEYKQSDSHILIISQCLLSSLSSNSPNFLTRLSLDPICLLHQVCPHCRATSTEPSF